MFGQSTLIAIGVAFLIGLLSGAGGTYKVEEWRWTAATKTLEDAAAQKLAVATKDAMDTQADYQRIKDEREKEHADHTAAIDAAQLQNRDLAGRLGVVLGRLRNPGSGAGGSGSVPGGSGSPAVCGELQAANDKLASAVASLAQRGNDIAHAADLAEAVAVTCRDSWNDIQKVKSAAP